jgi:DNA-binding NtrC family response regulator
MSAMTPRIARAAGGALIASPSKALREQVLHSLNNRWRPIQHALGGADALAKLEEGGWQVLFLDRRLPDLDSEELRAIIERRFPGFRWCCWTPMPNLRQTRPRGQIRVPCCQRP